MLDIDGSLYDEQTELPVVHWTATQLEKQRSCGAHRNLGVVLTLRYFSGGTALRKASASASQCYSLLSPCKIHCLMRPGPRHCHMLPLSLAVLPLRVSTVSMLKEDGAAVLSW